MLSFRKTLCQCFSPSGIAFTSSFYHLLSTATREASPHSSSFAVEYLTRSCGLTSDEAIRASKRIPFLESPDKPDAVLQFLRQAGIAEHSIRTAALRDPRFLRFSVEECFKPRMAELQEIGFSPSQISLVLSICPSVFTLTKLQQRIQFWLQIVGSVEKLLVSLSRNNTFLSINPENSVVPNISFLKDQCKLSARQIDQLIRWAPRLITSSPEALKTFAKRAVELGFPNSSGMFIYSLLVVSSLTQSTIDAKLLNLKSFGLSQEEVTLMIHKCPHVLLKSEESIGRKFEFLIKEAGCDNSYVVQNPYLFNLSLEKRLIPRSLVRKLLKSKGLPVAHQAFGSFVKPSENRFVEKFVLPYQHAIPDLHQAYIDACAGKTAVTE